MAAPVDAARTGTNITTAATSHALNVGSPTAGMLLIVFVRFAGAPGTVTFTGYTQLGVAETSDASDDETRIYYRVADGSEGATDTMTTVNSVKLAAITWNITGANNTVAPTINTPVVGIAANINPGAVPVVDLTALPILSTVAVFGETGAGERQAQSFVALGTTITNVGFFLFKNASPTDNFLLNIETDASGSPSGSVVAAVATVNAAGLTTTPTLTNFGVSIAVTIGQTYWIVLSRSGARDGTNTPQFSAGPSIDYYPDGVRKARNSGVWGSAAPNDSVFKLDFSGVPSKDYLFITLIGMDSETATATAPTGYSNTANANSGTGGAVATNCMIWGASKQATGVSSEDPGAWTSSAPNAGVTAFTIAVPAVAVVEPKHHRYASNQVAVMRPALR